MCDRMGRKVGGGGGLIMQCWHEGLGAREPVVVVYAFASSSTRAEPCSLGQGSCSGCRMWRSCSRLPQLAFIFRRSVSHDGSSVPVEGVAGCETVQGEKRILILSSDGAFVFLHTCVKLPTGLAHS